MNLILLGGSFNPPHLGHLFLAEVLRVDLQCPRILFIPANIPAHKTPPGSVTPAQRLRMVSLAIRGNPSLGVDDCEIRRGGVSYTIETVREIKDRLKLREKPGLVLGDDLVESFHTWKDWESLCEEASIIVAGRQAVPVREPDFTHVPLRNLKIPVSSSDIRERVRTGGAFRYLVTENIYTYIKRHGLYAD